jgi:AcrR family transcriptional regulator
MEKKIHRPHLRTAKDARAVRTRAALRHALLRLLDFKSLDDVTIVDICDTADVGYTTFFRHHPTKESLLADIAADQIGHLVGLSLAASDATDTRAGSVALFTYVHEHRKLWSTLLTGGAEGAMRSEFLRLSRQIASTRAHLGVWPPADIISILIAGSTIDLLSWWLRQKKPLAVEEVAEIHEGIVVLPALKVRPMPPTGSSASGRDHDKARGKKKRPSPGSRSK